MASVCEACLGSGEGQRGVLGSQLRSSDLLLLLVAESHPLRPAEGLAEECLVTARTHEPALTEAPALCLAPCWSFP